MRKIWIIACREFKAAIMNKAFLVSLILLPILMGGSYIIGYLTKDIKSLQDKTFVIIDRTPGSQIFPHLNTTINFRNEKLVYDKNDTTRQKEPKFIVKQLSPSEATPEAKLQQRLELAEQVRNKQIYGFLDIGENIINRPDITNPEFQVAHATTEAANIIEFGRDLDKVKAKKLPDDLVIRYYSNSPTYNEFWMTCRELINRTLPIIRAQKEKIDPILLTSIMTTVPITSKSLPRINPVTGQVEDGSDVNFMISFFVPFGIVMIMFMVIMVGATPLMQGVVEEKMQRISEVLLSSAKPFQIMMGKLLGGVGVSMVLGLMYLTGAYLAAHQYGFLDYITPSVMIWFLIFLALAVLMFGSLFIAVGAACTDLKETQSLLTPVMLLVFFPLFFLSNLITEPEGTLATALSFFPFATPTIMTTRIAIPPGVPWWQPYVGVVVVLATTLFCVWVASRIFRVGLLMQGKGANFSELVKWVFQG